MASDEIGKGGGCRRVYSRALPGGAYQISESHFARDRRKVQQPPCTMTFGPTGYKRDGVSLPVLDERSTTAPGERRAEGSYRAWLQACYDLSEDKIQCPRVILALRRAAHAGDLISREQAIGAFAACPNCAGVGWTAQRGYDGEAEQVQCECSAILAVIGSLPAIAPDAIEAEYREAAVAWAEANVRYQDDGTSRGLVVAEWRRFSAAKSARDAR